MQPPVGNPVEAPYRGVGPRGGYPQQKYRNTKRRHDFYTTAVTLVSSDNMGKVVADLVQ